MAVPNLLDVTAIMQELRELRQRIDDGPQPVLMSHSLPGATIVKEKARMGTNFKEQSLPTVRARQFPAQF